MASTKVRGITIELGADVTGINKALTSVNKEIGTTQKALKDVDRLLKLDPTNTELLAQKHRLLTTAVTETKTKLDALKRAQKEVGEELRKTGEGQEQYDALTREIISCEHELENLERAAAESNVALSKIKATADKVATTAGNIGRKMAPITAGLTAIGVAAVSAASDLTESLNKVEVAFGDSADYVKEFSETTLDSFGIAKGSALDMAALFGDMATSMGLPQQEAAKMSTSLVGLAGDLASFKNIELDTAQTALKGIFTGETESLKTLGIVMTQTNLDAYALANGFNKTTKEMTESEKVQLRYQYILDKTKNAQGDFSNTADGTANSIRIFKESLKELEEELGENLLPIITPIIQSLTDLVKKFGDLDDGTQKTIVYIGLFVAAISPIAFAISGIASAVSGLAGVFAKIGGIFTASSTAATTAASTTTAAAAATTSATTGMAAGLMSTLATVSSVFAGITLYFTGVVAYIGTKGDEMKKGFEGLDKWMQQIFLHDWSQNFGKMGEVLNSFLQAAKPVWDSFKKQWDLIIVLCKSVWMGEWEGIWKKVKDVFREAFNGLVAIVEAPIKGIISVCQKAFEGMAAMIKAPINSILGVLNSVVNAVNTVIAGFNRIDIRMPKWLGGQSWQPHISYLPSVPMLANGGVLSQGTAIVGEAGAELVNVYNGQATVTPLTNTAGHGDITKLLETYLPYLAEVDNSSIVLDSGVLVGQIAPQMSSALGRIYSRELARR